MRRERFCGGYATLEPSQNEAKQQGTQGHGASRDEAKRFRMPGEK